MNQQVCDDKYRLIVLFTDADFDDGAVLFGDNAMKRKRNRCPLIFLDAAVIVRVQICKSLRFI